jgi:2-(1,2-epoxy-1,2-dihydrophenyl)acetyl-CoA isomerase
MSEGTSTITFVMRDAVANIELNRPDTLNAWTPGMGQELLQALRLAAADPAVRAILITGAGRAFSAGADVKVPRDTTPDGAPDLHTRLRRIYNPIVLEIRAAPKPVVAAVNGAAAGLGCALALACDLVVAGESAYFLLPFVKLGLIPDAGGAFFMVARIGYARAMELAMLGEKLPAPHALDWGLINAVHPDDELRSRAEELARELANGPTVAYANLKRALDAAAHAALATQLTLEAELQQRHATTADYAEGVLAFKEKRAPRFVGR